jgi:acyl-homoserine lactone synthase
MIHVVTAGNRHLYGEALTEMHRLRRVHFIEERGWAAMTVRAGGEYDHFDDAQAIYLLSLGADGRVGCSMRMRPAETGSLLTDLFPHLLAADEPSLNRPDVWEISRYFAAPHCRGRAGTGPQAEIRLAALEVARARGVNRLVGMIDLEILPGMLSASGWRVRPLGLPAAYAEGIAQAIEVRVSNGAVVDMAEMYGLEPGVSLELDPARAPNLPPHEIEVLLALAQSRTDHSRVIVALVRRILAIQAQTDDEHLLGMVAYVEALLRGETQRAH